MASALSHLKSAVGKIEPAKSIIFTMNASAKLSHKQKYTDVKKLAKMLTGMGKDVSISVSGNGFTVASMEPVVTPNSNKNNPWDEVL